VKVFLATSSSMNRNRICRRHAEANFTASPCNPVSARQCNS